MEDQNFCSEWVTLLYPNVLYNVLYECLFIINNFIIKYTSVAILEVELFSPDKLMVTCG